jgi:hypothetical protein
MGRTLLKAYLGWIWEMHHVVVYVLDVMIYMGWALLIGEGSNFWVSSTYYISKGITVFSFFCICLHYCSSDTLCSDLQILFSTSLYIP